MSYCNKCGNQLGWDETQREHDRRCSGGKSSNEKFLTSALIGAATGSALLGGLLGGDMLGGVAGDLLDGDLFD
jgi:hypothetical protein